ncbi:hypothetical protein HDE_06779 [Halotydeus destructor]|nr:hypothetical protein HDE_06779 [Halotydeus destructor]
MVSTYIRTSLASFVKPAYSRIYGRITSAITARSSGTNTNEDELANQFELTKLPKLPRPTKRAFDFFHEDKKIEGLQQKPPVQYTQVDTKYAWDSIKDADRQRYTMAAVQDVNRYRKQLQEYNAIMNQRVTVGQMIEWMRTPHGQVIVKELVGLPDKEKVKLKRSLSAYTIYVSHYKNTICSKVPLKGIAEKWRSLTPEQKEPFMKQAKEAKIDYLRKVEELKALEAEE